MELLQLKSMVVKVEIQLMDRLSPSEAENFWEWKQPLWFSSLLWIGEEHVLLALQNAITHVMWCGCYLENQSTKLDWINCLKGTWLFWMKSCDFVHIWILVRLNSEIQTKLKKLDIKIVRLLQNFILGLLGPKVNAVELMASASVGLIQGGLSRQYWKGIDWCFSLLW